MNSNNSQQKPPFYIRNFKFLVFLLFVVLLVPGYFLFINPENQTYRTNKDLLANQERELEQKKNQLLELRKTLVNYESINELDRAKVREILPYGPSEPDLYINISSLVEASGAKLETINIELNEGPGGGPSEESLIQDKKSALAGGQIKTARVRLSVSEINYTKVKSLFNLIENNVRLLDIKSFNFNPSEGTLDLVMVAYYLK
ncbi:hypothetical protein GYA13_03750 [Candidatus Kuenenbacteria bacterium]|nr:hypothetical protein [Candidatus Kuenenbacteria bacterium]